MSTDHLDNSEVVAKEFARQRSITEAEDHDNFVKSFEGKRRLITVEPLIILYIIIMYLQVTVMNQYIYFRVGVDFNLTTNETLAHVCDPSVNSSVEKEKTDRIQSIYTYYSMFIQLSSCIFTVITAPFYCVFSDRYGRKAMFLIPGVGVFVKSLFEILIQVFRWPLYAFIITEGVYGMCGGFNFAIGLSYSYAADISTQQSRTKRMAILGAMMGIGALTVSLVSGFWIRAEGYLIPYIFTGCAAALCILYPLFILQEPPRMHDSKTNKPTPMQQMKKLFIIYKRNTRSETTLLIIVLLVFNLYYVSEMSGISLASTYLMAYPICMSIVNLSIYGFFNMLSINVGMIITVLLLSKCFRDIWLVLLCLLSGIAYTTQMALATKQTAVYIAVATNLFSFSAFPFIRGYLSKKMGPHEQGALFGGLVLSETVSGAITKVIIMYVYRETFLVYHGLVYLIITGFSVVAVILSLFAIPIDSRITASQSYTSLN